LISFEISNVPKDGTRNFYVGADFPIGDDTGGSTGPAASGFSVNVLNSTLSGQAIATVSRAINLTKNSDLAFGSVTRPWSGTSTVSVNALTGSRSISGGNGILIPSTTSRASYVVAGEGGQIFSISIPSNFTLSGPGSLTATTSSSASGTAILSGFLGSGGSFSFGVGGSLPVTGTTPVGSYSGRFNVTVQYN
jgi:hypothetical protein